MKKRKSKKKERKKKETPPLPWAREPFAYGGRAWPPVATTEEN